MNENVKNKDAEADQRKDEQLETDLEGTFPGSDPVSVSQPAKKDDDVETGGR